MQFVEKLPWIERFNDQLPPRRGRHLAAVHPAEQLHHRAGGDRRLDGDREPGRRSTTAAFLIMSGLLNGVFAALDAVLFYVFFEATLIPMFIIIGVWGGPNRVYAAVKFFLYTLLGSLLMLVALLYLYNKSGGSFAILDWHQLPLPLAAQMLALLRLPVRLRGEGADVAGAHLAARRARRGADRRLGGAGGDHAEARRLRLRALHAADPARRLARAGLADDRAVADRRRLHRPGGAGADRHEEADRLLVDLAHGLRDARLLHLQRRTASRARWCR